MYTLNNLPKVTSWLTAQKNESMYELIHKYDDGTVGIVTIVPNTPIHQGKYVITPTLSVQPIIHGVVDKVIETRPERGQYKDESARRNWARVTLH